MARPAKRSPASKPRPKAAKLAKPARPAAVKKAAKAAKAAKPVKKKVAGKTVRAKPAAPKGKPPKRPAGKPPPKPAAKPAPKAAAKPGGRAPAAKASAPTAKPIPAEKPAAPLKAAPKPAPEPPKKPRKPELTPKEIATIRASLVEQRNVFMREFSDLEDAAFNVSQSEISGEVSFDEEYADAGSFTFEREKEMSIGNNIRDLLDKVNHAINAIDRGTYGICENCGNPIAKARLQALPYSTLCLNCKQIDERTR